jgi:DNA-binding transcriptional MerR regulator
MGVRVGDQLRLPTLEDQAPSLTVAGLFAAETSLYTADVVLVGEADARALLGLPAGMATDLAIELTNPDESSVIASAIAESSPGARVIEKRLLERVHALAFGRRSGLVLGASIPALIALLLLAYDRASGLGPGERREIAVLKACGWSTGDVLLAKMLEAVVVAAIASSAGVLLAYAWAFPLGAAGLREVLAGWSAMYPSGALVPAVSLGQMLSIVALVTAPYVALAGGPAWRAAGIDPMEALRASLSGRPVARRRPRRRRHHRRRMLAQGRPPARAERGEQRRHLARRRRRLRRSGPVQRRPPRASPRASSRRRRGAVLLRERRHVPPARLGRRRVRWRSRSRNARGPLRRDHVARRLYRPGRSRPVIPVPRRPPSPRSKLVSSSSVEPAKPAPVSLPVAGSRPPKVGLLTTGDMARLSQSTVRTVRFYEECGVLEPAQRSEGGHRLFPTTELDKLLFVLDMRGAGLSLEEIKSILGLKSEFPSGARASDQACQVLRDHIAAMEQKISALTRLSQDFTRAAGILAGCRSCDGDPRFPASCSKCEVMDSPDELPRAVRVLWGVESRDPER